MLDPAAPFSVEYRPLHEPHAAPDGGVYFVRWQGLFPDGTASTFVTYYRRAADGAFVPA